MTILLIKVLSITTYILMNTLIILKTIPVQDLVSSYRRSVLRTRQLIKLQIEEGEQRPKGLLTCTPTRWGSTLACLRRVILLRNFLDRHMQVSTNIEFQQKHLTTAEYTLAQQVCDVLSPFEASTAKLGAEKTVTIAYVFEEVWKLWKGIMESPSSSLHHIIPKFQQSLKVELNRRFCWFFQTTKSGAINKTFLKPYLLATGLHPILKQYDFVSDILLRRLFVAATRSLLMEEMELRMPPEEEPATDSHIDVLSINAWAPLNKNASCSVNRYWSAKMPEQYREQLESQGLLAYWKRNSEDGFEALGELAREVLATPASSTSSERLFSSAGHLLSKRRNALLDSSLEMLLFLRSNWTKPEQAWMVAREPTRIDEAAKTAIIDDVLEDVYLQDKMAEVEQALDDDQQQEHVEYATRRQQSKEKS